MARTRLPSWGPPERLDLQRARRANGQTQQQCAEDLRARGLPGTSQAQVSDWERGAVAFPHVKTQAILREYIADALGSDTALHSGDDDAIDHLEHELTGEPLLGELQALALRTLIDRLHTSPLNEFDIAGIDRLFLNLGLKLPARPGDGGG